MPAPVGGLLPKGTKEAASQPNSSMRAVGGVKKASAVMNKSSFRTKRNTGNGEEAPTSQGCRQVKPCLCCVQVEKLNGSVILNPKKEKLKNFFKDNRVDPKEVYTSLVVDIGLDLLSYCSPITT